ncbi:MAG TPA: arabinofuranosidase catalytic domain-containing protein [Polyangia bacterium]|nr:arabinofuranosidase catalytic domain-containing protein [Polyangia bacterium]
MSSAGTPCDIFGSTGNTCVAAHSTVRVVYPGYSGPLYQVCKGTFAAGPNSCTSGMTMDIGSVDGYADSASQDAFCTGGTCTISIIYDQSPMKNDLEPSPPGGMKATPDNPANATALKTTLNGHTVYGVFIKVGMGYRAGCTGCAVVTAMGTATGDEPETEYMVTSQTGLVDGCCFDYGNAETDSHDDNNGTMEAVYFGGGVVWGTGSPGGHANGPWVMADLENGVYAGWENNQDQNISTNIPLKYNFVTAIVVGDTSDRNSGKGRFALYGGDATSGALTTLYDGVRPNKPGYNPTQKQGSIILGTGGDNSDGDGGQWFEGVMASGAASLAALNALQANIVAAGYGN